MTKELKSLIATKPIKSSFLAVLKWMQENDRNGDWLTATEADAQLVQDTIREWISEHGMEETAEVSMRIEFLQWIIDGRPRNWGVLKP